MIDTTRLNCIMPPYLLERLLESSDGEVRRAALATLVSTARLRGERTVRASLFSAAAPADGRRTLYDCQDGSNTDLAQIARTEDGEQSTDPSVNQAFDGFGATRQFYADVFDRKSVDDRGMRLDGYVHYGQNYNNAFWDGQKMVFGDGDGRIFTDFTGSLDVIAHELTHGVTQFTAGFVYHRESGALNESMSDVFGSLVKQWSLKQSADEADWLIGSEIFTPAIEADALRSMKAPGTAYNNALLGRDPQPDHMTKFVHLADNEQNDFGGVHINSGIPNRAFYLTAAGIGGFAWEAPGAIWYASLKASSARATFQQFADTTHAKAGELYGTGSAEQEAARAAWREVGIRVTGTPLAARSRGVNHTDTAADGTITARLDQLASQVKALTKEVSGLKKGRS